MKIKTILISGFLLLPVAEVAAHPGRLDDKGCHRVTEDWVYKSGKVLKAGTYHCHGRLNDMQLDGRQMLEDPDDKGRPAKEKKDKK